MSQYDESIRESIRWGKMLAKVFEIDVTKCQHWKGEMSIVAAIIKCSEVARYLKHLGIEHEPPARVSPKYQQECFLSLAPLIYLEKLLDFPTN